MGTFTPRFKRWGTLGLLAVALAVGVWWLGHIPYDPMAIYRPVPAAATVAGRHAALPERWNDLLANPLALALMRTAGVDPEGAALLTADEVARAWFEKLAGREGVLAYLPGRFGAPPAWMAVSHLGGQSQILRWQLALFDVPGYEREQAYPRRPVWRVATPDLDPRQTLVIAFGEGVLMACLSENPHAISEVLGAYDGTVRRLVEAEPSFRRMAEGDDRRVPDRVWIRDDSEWASAVAPGIRVDLPVLRGDALALRAVTAGLENVPGPDGAPMEFSGMAERLGNAPCAAFRLDRGTVTALAQAPETHRHLRFGLQMALDAGEGPFVLALLDGDFSGRLTLGVMQLLGQGLRVPTLAAATRVPDEAAAHAAVQRMLDASNARYRGAFVLRPMPENGVTIQVLESAGGDEWVDELPAADRPAYAVMDGWLLASSNLAALRKLVRGEAGPVPADGWPDALAGGEPVQAWLDLARSGKVARSLIATWSMVQAVSGGDSNRAIRERLNEARAWIDAFAPFGVGRAALARTDGETGLRVDLGLSGRVGSARMPSP